MSKSKQLQKSCNVFNVARVMQFRPVTCKYFALKYNNTF